MNAKEFNRIARLATYGSMIAEPHGQHTLNSLLLSRGLNDNVMTVVRAVWQPACELRIECTTIDCTKVVVWMKINEHDQLTFDFS